MPGQFQSKVQPGTRQLLEWRGLQYSFVKQQRFIARRFKPTDLYSDNGITFNGSKRVLDEMRLLTMEQRKDENLANFFANEGILWHTAFSPTFRGNMGSRSAVHQATYEKDNGIVSLNLRGTVYSFCT